MEVGSGQQRAGARETGILTARERPEVAAILLFTKIFADSPAVPVLFDVLCENDLTWVQAAVAHSKLTAA